MPKYLVQLIRWEPQFAEAVIEADSAEQAAACARKDARKTFRAPVHFEQYEVDTEHNARTSNVHVTIIE